MADRSVTPHDIVVLQDILSLTRRGLAAGPTETAYVVLDLLEQLLHSDFVSFQDMHVEPGSRFRRSYLQATEDGEHLVMDAQELAQHDRDNPADALSEHWWQLPCSLVDRTGVAQVSSIRTHFGEREWATHPAQVDYLRVVDEILLAYPLGHGRSLRILTAREQGTAYGLRELTFMELLLPHLRPLLEATVAEHAGGSDGTDPHGVTLRQREILHLVALGLPNKQVGHQLGISEGTVRKHLENVYERLGVQSRTEAIFWLRLNEDPAAV